MKSFVLKDGLPGLSRGWRSAVCLRKNGCECCQTCFARFPPSLFLLGVRHGHGVEASDISAINLAAALTGNHQAHDALVLLRSLQPQQLVLQAVFYVESGPRSSAIGVADSGNQMQSCRYLPLTPGGSAWKFTRPCFGVPMSRLLKAGKRLEDARDGRPGVVAPAQDALHGCDLYDAQAGRNL